MKLFFFIGLGFFCFNQVISTSTDEIESENIPEDIFESNELCSRMDGKTQFMDLNVDCQLLVLKQLDFVSLLSLTKTNNQLKLLVSIILKQIFRKKSVEIVFTGPSSIEIFDDYIRIENFTIAEQLLNNFGHLIQKLKIGRGDLEMDSATRSIYKLVNLHCSKTLKEITLGFSENNFLEEFTNQFENVQNIYIRNTLETDRRLNEIFPSVRRLHFYLFGISNTDSINVKYTNLEHLKFFVNSNVGPFTEKWSTELIRKNSHIRSLELERASPNLIKIAADLLPQLERLKLEDIPRKHSIEPMAFANVKIFEIEGCYVNNLLPNIKFGNVEEIRTDGLADSMFGETGFFASNPKLKKLQLISDLYTIYHNTNAFKQLARVNSTLQDIFISKATRVEVETILQLIKNNKQLEKLQIMFYIINEREIISNVLSSKIGDKWSMEAYSNIIILKKKLILF